MAMELSLAGWKAAVAERFERFGHYGRKTLEEGWRTGEALIEVKRSMAHGEFTPWLESIGIAPRTARRLMELYRGFPENGQLGRFDSVDGALTALKNPEAAEFDNALEAVVSAGRDQLAALRRLGELLSESQRRDSAIEIPADMAKEALEFRREFEFQEVSGLSDAEVLNMVI